VGEIGETVRSVKHAIHDANVGSLFEELADEDRADVAGPAGHEDGSAAQRRTRRWRGWSAAAFPLIPRNPGRSGGRSVQWPETNPWCHDPRAFWR